MPSVINNVSIRKDAALDRLASDFNVAQFVSFAPSQEGPKQQFCRLADLSPNYQFASMELAIEALFRRSPEGTINIRSFSIEQPQSREFLYGLRSKLDVRNALARLAAEGSFTIANETVDVSDGGVSGVAMGDVVEFRPDSTPRGVERSGFASLPFDWANALFSIVYGFEPDLGAASEGRLEFSLHPRPRGWKQTHTLLWEFGPKGDGPQGPEVYWPNDFSRMLGDKVFGLLLAHLVGMRVPFTTVINRRIAPFSFGLPTGSAEHWIRTSPAEQVPGKFTTARGWSDPFRLISDEDPDHRSIASILSQAAVPAEWSGAVIEGTDKELIIEGVSGAGDKFMLGSARPSALPSSVREEVAAAHFKLKSVVGPVRFEWVFDGSNLWIVQLHSGSTSSSQMTIVPGEATQWITFSVADGLEPLRELITTLPDGCGLVLEGEVGITSHIADVVRKARVPTRIRAVQQ